MLLTFLRFSASSRKLLKSHVLSAHTVLQPHSSVVRCKLLNLWIQKVNVNKYVCVLKTSYGTDTCFLFYQQVNGLGLEFSSLKVWRIYQFHEKCNTFWIKKHTVILIYTKIDQFTYVHRIDWSSRSVNKEKNLLIRENGYVLTKALIRIYIEQPRLSKIHD